MRRHPGMPAEFPCGHGAVASSAEASPGTDGACSHGGGVATTGGGKTGGSRSGILGVDGVATVVDDEEPVRDHVLLLRHLRAEVDIDRMAMQGADV